MRSGCRWSVLLRECVIIAPGIVNCVPGFVKWESMALVAPDIPGAFRMHPGIPDASSNALCGRHGCRCCSCCCYGCSETVLLLLLLLRLLLRECACSLRGGSFVAGALLLRTLGHFDIHFIAALSLCSEHSRNQSVFFFRWTMMKTEEERRVFLCQTTLP